MIKTVENEVASAQLAKKRQPFKVDENLCEIYKKKINLEKLLIKMLLLLKNNENEINQYLLTFCGVYRKKSL